MSKLIKYFLAACLLYAPLPSELHADGNLSYADQILSNPYFKSGLFPYNDKLSSQIDFLFRLSRVGIEIERAALNVPVFEEDPYYQSFLLHLAMERRPRIRTRNYIGEFTLYPALKYRLGDGDWLKYSSDFTFDEKVAWLKETSTYRKARSWEQNAMEESLEIENSYSQFVKASYIDILLLSEPAESFCAQGSGFDMLPSSECEEAVNLADSQLDKNSPFRLRFTKGKIEIRYLLPTTNVTAEIMTPPTQLHQSLPGQDSSLVESAFTKLLKHLEHDNRISILTYTLALQRLDELGAKAINSALNAGLSPGQAQAFYRAREAMNDQTRARIRLIRQWRGLPHSERINIFLKKTFIPNIKTLAAFRPSSEQIAQFNAASSARFKGLRPEIKQSSARLLQRVALVALLLNTAVNVADSYMTINSHMPKEEIARSVSRVIADLSIFIGLRAVSAINPIGIGFIAVTIALEIGNGKINSNIPTLKDLSDYAAELGSDAYLTFDKLVSLAGRKNTAIEEWLNMRHKFYAYVAINKINLEPTRNPYEGDEVSQDVPYNTTDNFSDASVSPSFNSNPYVELIDFEVTTGGFSHACNNDTAKKGYYEMSERIAQSEHLGDSRLVEFERLSVAFAYQYLDFIFLSLQQAGQLNFNSFLYLCEEGILNSSKCKWIYSKFKNVTRAKWLPDPPPSSYDIDLQTEIYLRNEIVEELTKEIDAFIEVFKDYRERLSPPFKTLLKKDPRIILTDHIAKVIAQFEYGYSFNEEIEFSSLEDYEPGEKQIEAIICLREYKKAIEDDLKSFPPAETD